MNRISDKITAFVIFGILIVLFVFGLILFWTALIWGAVLGIVLYVIALVRIQYQRWHKKKYGETGIIEHDKDE